MSAKHLLILLSVIISGCTCNYYAQFSKDLVAAAEKSYDGNLECKNKIQDCLFYMKEYGEALGEMKEWAIKMLDATSKLQSGITHGNIVDLGDFDLCLSIDAEIPVGRVRGKHCMGMMQLDLGPPDDRDLLVFNIRALMNIPQNTSHPARSNTQSFSSSLCIPDVCKGEEAALIFNKLLVSINVPVKLLATENACQTMKSIHPNMDTLPIVAACFFAAVAVLMVEETIYDVYLHYKGAKPKHQLLVAFSVVTNGKKIFAVSKSNDQLTCLAGLRLISMMWVILGHRFFTSILTFSISNFQDVLEWKDSPYSMYIGSGTVSVDTFFVIGGLLVSYVFMKSTEKTKGIFFNIPMFYLHRYLRLTPALAALILFYSLIPYIGSGPTYTNFNQMYSAPCRDHWWQPLLYIHNYSKDVMCLGHTWYLDIDMQLYLLSPILLLSIKKWPKATIGFIGCLIAASMAWSFYVAWEYEMLSSLLNVSRDTPTYMSKYYMVIQTRATPWLLGFILGYLLYRIKHTQLEVNLSKFKIALGWALCTIALFSCVFAGHEDLMKADNTRLSNSLHIMLVRPVWGLGICWIVFACVLGHGGPINDFLSLPIFQIWSRLTYSIYLWHLVLMNWLAYSRRSNIWFSDFQMIYFFWGDFIFTTAIALIWCLAFESPIVILEKILFRKPGEAKSERIQNGVLPSA